MAQLFFLFSSLSKNCKAFEMISKVIVVPVLVLKKYALVSLIYKARLIELSKSLIYNCTTSSPFKSPTFLTLTDTFVAAVQLMFLFEFSF